MNHNINNTSNNISNNFTSYNSSQSNTCETCLFFMTVEHSPNMVLITDTNGVIEYVNKKFSKISGYSKEEAVGKTPSILKSGVTPDSEYDQIWKTIKMGIEWRGEILNRKKTGELYWEHGSIIPLKNQNNEIIKFFAIKQDISENREIDDEVDHLMAEMDSLMMALDIKNRELSSKNEELDNFAHTVAHDLKAPLATLGSYLLLLKKKMETKDNLEHEISYTILRS